MLKNVLATSFVCIAGLTCAIASPPGSLAGHILDEVGRPVEGARVTVTGRGAVGVHHATTNQEGLYQLAGLPSLERLDVTASVLGKAPVTYSGLVIRQGAVTRRDFRLRPFGVKEMLILYDSRVPYHALAVEG